MPPRLPLKPILTVKFSIVDYAYDPAIPNVVGQVFKTDEAAFLAGYAAAGVTKTGKVGTFGGLPIPTVTIFMDGFAEALPNTMKLRAPHVEVLGWDPADLIPKVSSACPLTISKRVKNSPSP